MNDGFNGGGLDRYDQDVDDARNQKLEFEIETKDTQNNTSTDKPEDAKTKKQFLQKMKTKRQLQEEQEGVEDSVVNLGFVKNLATNMSANQLAASGIQLSMRSNLIKFIKNMDQAKITKNEEKLLTALQNSQGEQKDTENNGSSLVQNEVLPPAVETADQIVEQPAPKDTLP